MVGRLDQESAVSQHIADDDAKGNDDIEKKTSFSRNGSFREINIRVP